MKKEVRKTDFFLGQDSHAGYERLINEDDCGWFSTPAGELFVVADGLRGPAGGGVASRMAVSAFREHLGRGGSSEELLTGALMAADAAVIESGEKYPELRGLGASLAALLLNGGDAYYTHVGAGRIYLLSGGELTRLTSDDTLAQELVDTGRLTEAQAAVSSERHVLTQSVGCGLKVGNLKVGRLPFQRDDTFLLCTAGLPDLVNDAEIREILKLPYSPQDRARKLVETAVAADGADNITVQVLAFKPGKDMPEPLPPAGGRRRLRSFLLGFICGFASCWGGLYAWQTWGHLIRRAIWPGP